MIGESEVADASDFALFQQEVQHAVVQIAGTAAMYINERLDKSSYINMGYGAPCHLSSIRLKSFS